MRKLKAEPFGGTVHITDSEQIAELLTIRFADGFNVLWISGPTPYPYLVLGLAPVGAALHYFPEEDHPGWFSVGTGGAEGSVEFRTNTPQEPIEISAHSVVSVSLATKAVSDLRYESRPRIQRAEPYEARGSRTALGAGEGEAPSLDSTSLLAVNPRYERRPSRS